jgi:hypothetical protein
VPLYSASTEGVGRYSRSNRQPKTVAGLRPIARSLRRSQGLYSERSVTPRLLLQTCRGAALPAQGPGLAQGCGCGWALPAALSQSICRGRRLALACQACSWVRSAQLLPAARRAIGAGGWRPRLAHHYAVVGPHCCEVAVPEAPGERVPGPSCGRGGKQPGSLHRLEPSGLEQAGACLACAGCCSRSQVCVTGGGKGRRRDSRRPPLNHLDSYMSM